MSKPPSDLQHHVDAAAAEGGSIADYARRHGLNPRRLYDYRYHEQLTKPRVTKPDKPKAPRAERSTPTSPFSRLTITTPVPSVAKVQLTNGVVIELSSESLVLLLPTLVTL